MLHVGGQAEHMVVITVKPVHGARYAVRDLAGKRRLSLSEGAKGLSNRLIRWRALASIPKWHVEVRYG